MGGRLPDSSTCKSNQRARPASRRPCRNIHTWNKVEVDWRMSLGGKPGVRCYHPGFPVISAAAPPVIQVGN